MSSQNLSLYPTSSTGEIDLRDEFDKFLHGDGAEIPKGRYGLLRRLKKDSEGNLIKCACVDPLTHEPDLDSLCPYCLGEGIVWEEELITYYKVIVGGGGSLTAHISKTVPGELNIPFVYWYVAHSVNPTLQDKLIEVELSLDGEVVVPLNRIGTYRLETVEPFRSDNGRVEYFRLASNLQAGKK